MENSPQHTTCKQLFEEKHTLRCNCQKAANLCSKELLVTLLGELNTLGHGFISVSSIYSNSNQAVGRDARSFFGY